MRKITFETTAKGANQRPSNCAGLDSLRFRREMRDDLRRQADTLISDLVNCPPKAPSAARLQLRRLHSLHSRILRGMVELIVIAARAECGGRHLSSGEMESALKQVAPLVKQMGQRCIEIENALAHLGGGLWPAQ